MNEPVLLLNQNYEPLNVCRTRRAIVLLSKGKAELLANGRAPIQSARQLYPRPSVIRMLYHVRRPRPTVRLSRREVFVRDEYLCQYCAETTIEPTVDHVIPRRLGGRRRWENLATACRRCNLRKAGRTPHEAGMRLLRQPRRPKSAIAHLVRHVAGDSVDPTWRALSSLDWSRPRRADVRRLRLPGRVLPQQVQARTRPRTTRSGQTVIVWFRRTRSCEPSAWAMCAVMGWPGGEAVDVDQAHSVVRLNAVVVGGVG